MVEIKDFDADCYELEFEENTQEDERKFYVQNYPNVNMVADRRLHCTTCDTHIGCAVANEQTIRMHPVLRVTHCKKCHTFYNSGEFSKGEDGSELYCRWCGQGGEVYCCSKCPYVFCKKCILQNLSKNVITEIESNDDWQCFSCSPNVMWALRAQHWALVNYIEKTKKQILNEEKDDEKIYELMNKDPTLCCKEKKANKTRRSVKSKRRRRHSSTSDSDCSIPEPKRVPDHSAVLPKLVTQPQQKTSKQLDELVCTPDILSMFSEPSEEPSASAPTRPMRPTSKTLSSATPTTVTQKSASASQPPPLIIRQLPSSSSVQTVRFPNRQFSAVPRVTAPPPAYYTVNGFRVDLNAAAQQETYRLPNGKLIQVKKQTAANQATGATHRNAAPLQPRSNNPNPNPYSIRFNIQQPSPPVQIPHNVPPPVAHQTPAAQTLHQQHLQQQQQILNGIANAPMTPMASGQAQAQSTIANRYPSTPLGKAQTELEKEIHGAQEICQQIVGKCNTLMKSNAYKSVRTFNDVKDLHLHLSYLFTYTIDKFTTLQTKCTDAMKTLTNAHDAANKLADKKNKYTNVDDDLEVVEPTTVCIEIDSDDEAEPKKTPVPVGAEKTKSKQPRKTSHQPKPNESVTVSVSAPIEIVDNENDELELPTPPALDSENESYDRESDEKLKSLPKVVLEKDEEIERRLQEILEKQKSENGSASPVNDVSEVQINETMDTSGSIIGDGTMGDAATEVSDSETNATHKSIDNGEKDDDVAEKDDNVAEKDDDVAEKDDDVAEKDDNEDEMIESVEKDSTREILMNENGEKDDTTEKNEEITKVDESDNNVEDNAGDEKTEKSDKNNDGDKEERCDGDLTNGQNNDEDESMADCTVDNPDVRSPDSLTLTDNLENDLLDEMDHQNNLTDNSFENISSPDMFDDMSKNGFDKATDNIVTLSTENADPDLV